MTIARDNIRSVGGYALMIVDIFRDIRRRGVHMRELLNQIVRMGTDSIPIVLLTASFTGMVLALQTAYGLHRFGAKNYVGNVVGLGIIRELGPVLTSLMLCGRVGAGITAQLASMVVTEQVDAMRALGANPISKLVTPRVIAGMISLPLLVVLANAIGVYGGLLVAVYDLQITAYTYYRSFLYTVVIRDVMEGLLKACMFGFILTTVACYKGLNVKGGTEGVGLYTTSSVVTSSVLIFISDFFLTKLLLML